MRLVTVLSPLSAARATAQFGVATAAVAADLTGRGDSATYSFVTSNAAAPGRVPPLCIAPSILASDFGRLAEEVQAAERAGADWIHVDVMDGSFVPNITLGPPIVRAVRAATKLPVDVHLMIADPDRYLEQFVEAGADILSVHVEACTHLHRTLSHIRHLGRRAGVVLNPATHEDTIRYVLDCVDLVLVMSVNPGFGGQHFIPAVLPKVRAVRSMIDRLGRHVDLEIDGGITAETAPLVTSSGARVLVAGTAVFERPDYAEAIQELREAGRRGVATE
ncbi:MAG: ribulose-phosphate 3-epimerase [Myxococcales bacterium]|nr:ribulose-phosphate 3-epimerase [Myxococcales bacterium]